MHDDEIFDEDRFGGGRADRAGDAANAQAAAPTPWVLSPDMGYGYGKDGKTFSYKMGTNNAKDLLKGAKKVPKGTLFFIGENGQLYMRSGPYLEGDEVQVRAGVIVPRTQRARRLRGVVRCRAGAVTNAILRHARA